MARAVTAIQHLETPKIKIIVARIFVYTIIIICDQQNNIIWSLLEKGSVYAQNKYKKKEEKTGPQKDPVLDERRGS